MSPPKTVWRLDRPKWGHHTTFPQMPAFSLKAVFQISGFQKDEIVETCACSLEYEGHRGMGRQLFSHISPKTDYHIYYERHMIERGSEHKYRHTLTLSC